MTSFYINFGGVSAASYYLTTQGREFAAAAGPAIARHAATASAVLARGANAIGIGATYAKFAPKVADFAVKYSPDFKALTNLSPVHGLVAGQGLTILAGIVESGIMAAGMKNWAVIRLVLSHAIAGAAVFGLSALAFKVGLAAAAITIGGAVTLTATTLAITAVVRTVFALINCCCCGAAPAKDGKDEEQEQTPDTETATNRRPNFNKEKVD